jgi:hypothetical protein
MSDKDMNNENSNQLNEQGAETVRKYTLTNPLSDKEGAQVSYTPKSVRVIIDRYKRDEPLDAAGILLMDYLENVGFNGAGIVCVMTGEQCEEVEFDN